MSIDDLKSLDWSEYQANVDKAKEGSDMTQYFVYGSHSQGLIEKIERGDLCGSVVYEPRGECHEACITLEDDDYISRYRDLCVELDEQLGELLQAVLYKYMSRELAHVERVSIVAYMVDIILTDETPPVEDSHE
jgi:hypothetical protein